MKSWLRRLAVSFVSLAGVALILASGGSADNVKTWSKSFGGEFEDWVSVSVPTADGGYLFVGSRDGSDSALSSDTAASKLWIVKLNDLGEITWERGLADPTLAAEDGNLQRSYSRVVAADDGGAWLVGKETSVEGGDAIVVTRLDPAGQPLWTSVANGSADFATPLFHADGRSSLDSPVAERDAVGALWVAARSTAFARDTRGGDADRQTGINMSAIYLARFGADGNILAQRHVAPQTSHLGFSPKKARALSDGGVALTAMQNGEDYLVVADAAGQLRSVTFIVDAATVGTGSRDRLTINDFVPMRLNVNEGLNDNDGFVFAGNLVDESFVARYFGNERDPDDLTEGSDDQEFRPLENSWRIEISEITNIWVVAPKCGATPRVNHRCDVLVAGASREVPGAMAIAGVDTEANISGFIRLVPDIAEVCQMRREFALSSEGRALYRLHARNLAGQSGTLVIDDQRIVIQPFVAHDGVSCGSGASAGVASDGEVVALTSAASSNEAGERFNDLTVSRYRVDGARRWQVTYGDTPRRWTRAMALGRDAEGYVIAASTGPTNGFEGRAAALIRLGLEGELLWQRRIPDFNIDAGSEISSNSLAVRDDAYLLIGMDSEGAVHGMQFDGRGTLQWQKPLWGARGYGVGAVTALRDGGWVVVGGGSEQRNAPVMRLDGGGESVWTRGLQGLTEADSIVEDAQGNLFLGGRAPSGPLLAKLDSSGSVLWSQELRLARSRTSAVRVGALPDGGVFLGTTTFGTRSEGVGDLDGDGDVDEIDHELREYNAGDLVLWHFDADGVQASNPKRIGGAYRDVLSSLTTTEDGGALLGAVSFSLGERNDRPEAWVLRLGPDGTVEPNCAAETAAANYQPDRLVLGNLTGTPANAATFAPAASTVSRQVIGSTLAVTSLQPATQVLRQCSGSVRPETGRSEANHHLRVVQGNSAYSGVVTSVPAGILCGIGGGGTCGADFAVDMLVTLRVDPASVAQFEGWTGCDTVDGPLCLVRMTDDRTVTATFAADPRSPTVNLNVEIAGRGTVMGTGGISCRATTTGTCSSLFQRGSTAQLTATPDAGRSFLGWGGSCASFGQTRGITFVMNEGAACAARFSGPPPGSPQVTVSYRTFRGGDVVSTPAGIECGAANSLCSEGFANNSDVTLDAEATVSGWEFESFQCSGQPRHYGRSITLTDVRSDIACFADFSASIERLHLRIVRDSGGVFEVGRVYSTPAGIDCRHDCDRPFLRNETVLLRADTENAYYVSGWSGCTRVIPDSTNNLAPTACEVRVDQRKDVVAFFGGIGPGPNNSRNLLVNFAPGSSPGLVTHHSGDIDCTPTDGDCIGAFTLGELVTLRIEPLGASTLASNSGCDTFTVASGTTPASCQLTMSADRVVTFGFLAPDNPPVAAFSIEPANPIAGQPVTFDASASSDDHGIASYRWSFLDNGAINSTSSVASTIYPVAGSFNARLSVTDAAGQTDDEVRTVVVSPASINVAPAITTQPQNVTVNVGETASFSVNVIGSQPLSYQWQRNGVNLPGGTTDVYTTSAVTTPDDGAVFRVIVSNSVGSETSAGAVLTVGHGWRRVGGSVVTINAPNRPSLAIDAAGTRYVSYVASSALGQMLFVRRFDGSQWNLLGAGVESDGDGSARENALITGADSAPIIAWNAGARVRVARWNGTQWAMLANDLSIDTQDIYGTTGIQLVRTGNDLVAAWIETFGFPIGEVRVAVKRFDAATSTWSGEYVPDVFGAQQIRLTLDAAGLPMIAYVQRTPTGGISAVRVVRQTSTGWGALGGDIGPVPTANSSGFTANYGLDIRTDSTGAPVVVGSADGLHIFGFRHDGGSWQPMAGAGGVIVSLDPATQNAALMALAQSGNSLALAYTRNQRPAGGGGGSQIITEFLQWNGTTWEPLGTPLPFLAYSLAPQLSGNPSLPQFAAEYRPPSGLLELVVQQFVP